MEECTNVSSFNNDIVENPYVFTDQCAGVEDGTKYGVPNMCFDYFECHNGEALYHECDPYYRFDEEAQKCVSDKTCYTGKRSMYKALCIAPNCILF